MPDTASTASSWTDDIDQLLENIRHNSVVLSNEYKRQYFSLKSSLQYYKLPVIVISTFNASLSVGLQPYCEQQTISVITCLLALICSVIGSVELYMEIAKRMSDSLSLSKDYYHLSVGIYKVLVLSHDNRPSDSRIVLEEFWNTYCKLAEHGHLIDNSIRDKLTEIRDESLALVRQKSMSFPATPKAVGLTIETMSDKV